MTTRVRTQRPLGPIELATLDLLGGFSGVPTAWDRKGRPLTFGQEAVLRVTQPEYYRIGEAFIGQVRVSTVWLGGMAIRGEPFETMIFADGDSEIAQALHDMQWRYRTLRQAEIGHRRIVRLAEVLQRSPKVLAKPRKTRNRHWR